MQFQGFCVDTPARRGHSSNMQIGCWNLRATTQPASRPHGTRRGFTLVEVLVVIAIIALIVALLMVAIPQIQRQARSSVCLNNQRQLNIGFVSYYQDNSGRFMGVDTDRTGWDWVQTPQGTVAETETHLKNGRMWPYVGNFSVYKSPFDPFRSPPAGAATAAGNTRMRTYALNAFISTGEGFMWNGPQNWQVNTMGKIPLPSETLMTALEYDHRGYNINGFGIDVSGNGIWIDKIAPWHPGHFNVSFADGSVLSYRHMARQDVIDDFMTRPQNGIYWPGSDYEWLRRKMVPGMFQ
jgi:prepilin-type N-terminal cleavage/methylation domain-containing protein/prepilin-type processing-associated H-X9-DG protein